MGESGGANHETGEQLKPYYQDNHCTIYHGDCREILPTLDPVDIVLTDPPYGVGIDYGAFKDTPDNVRALVSEIIPQCISLSKRTVLTCATRQIHFYPPPTWILAWINRAGSYSNPWGFTCWQPILVYGKCPFLAECKGGRADIIDHSETAERNSHPCPKPERFWRKLLGRCSFSGVVLDPFMGSGTTLRAAKDLQRKAIGIEIEEKYCEIAVKRLRQEVLPLVG